MKYRYPLIYQSPQLNRSKQTLTKPIEVRHITSNFEISNFNASQFRNNFADSDDGLCLIRLTTYASDQGKKYPMNIGEDYSEDVRHQMADYLVSF